jgi:hypothetical protein
MKKFLFICVILFIANVGCKKMNIDGGGLCGCSPTAGPTFQLVIKNSLGEDLLNSKTSGAYSIDKIELYRKDGNGKVIPLNFSIRPPFSYGNEKFSANSLYSSDIAYLYQASDKSIFLKLGGSKLYELILHLNQQSGKVEKLFIDQKEGEKATGTIENYATIYYLTE